MQTCQILIMKMREPFLRAETTPFPHQKKKDKKKEKEKKKEKKKNLTGNKLYSLLKVSYVLYFE